ncbi:class I SAM-dependent methyltransferase [Bdellovibrio sp. ArHS]|uniref:class I SAM-dependent methyltransferase n=1 Tax=Bdellovibrio sp. ArHS TaxID=1569284 RepID=UPI0025BDD007|nr:class I SAM-dependent methyltransferase [Bdellovibrio sp. ArHS]
MVKKPERSYFHCEDCDFIFMNPAERLSAVEEKQRYDLHQNQESAGYLAFFAPLIKAVVDHFRAAGVESTQLSSLDYGCGPTAMLSGLLQAEGFETANYDSFYYPETEVFKRTYHLITSTEVWEHLHNPKEDIERMLTLLKPGGILAVMTSAHKGEAAFHDWHYRRDLTHVGFFSERSMHWLTERFRLHTVKMKSPYFIFQKMF